MASFRCYDNSDVIATLTMTNFHLNTTVVAIFPNAYFWRHSLHSNLVLTLKTNCIKPPSYARTAYVVVIRPSFLSDSFVKIWANCEIFLGKFFTPPPPPPGKNFPYAYESRSWCERFPPPPLEKLELKTVQLSNYYYCWCRWWYSLSGQYLSSEHQVGNWTCDKCYYKVRQNRPRTDIWG